MPLFKKLWRWLHVGDNRGALQFVLQYVLGPFSLLGVFVLIWHWYYAEPGITPFAFEIELGGHVTMLGSEEKVSLSIRNQGLQRVYAPTKFSCAGDFVDGLGAKLNLRFHTKDSVEVPSQSNKTVVYLVDHVGLIGLEGFPAISLNKFFSTAGAEIVHCNMTLKTSDDDAFARLSLSAAPSGPETLGFLAISGENLFSFP